MKKRALLRSLALASLALPALPGAARAEVILPPEGAAMNRLHLQFRWKPFKRILSDYTLEIVEDDGSADPFATGTPLVLVAARDEPRTVVTSGLAWGRSWAWRVSAQTDWSPGSTRTSEVHRFETLPLPAAVPVPALEIFPVSGTRQPGVTLFGLRNNATSSGLCLALDENGAYVYCLELPGGIGDVRLNDQGRLVATLRPAVLGTPEGRAGEMTLDGRFVWISPDGGDVHHEVFEMPNGNKLALTNEQRRLPYPWPSGPDVEWEGDRIVEYDLHSKQELWSWSTFDHYSYLDFGTDDATGQPFEPDRWTHGNAAIYNPLDDCVYYSSRHLDRITRIDRTSGGIVYNMGEQGLPAGDVAFGDKLFSHQHAPQLLANGNMIVYDNGNLREPLSDPRQTWAIELAFSGPPDAPTDAAMVWRYKLESNPGVPLFDAFVGDADRLPGGNTLVTAGRSAIIDEVNPAAELLARIRVGTPFPANLVYRSERIPVLVADTPHDTDGDADVDMLDLIALQVALTGPGSAGLAFPETLLDHDADDDLDQADVDALLYRLTGPGS